MLQHCVVIFLIAGSVIYASDDCEKRITDVCQVEKLPHKFPTTEEDLDKACTPVIEYFECGISRSERCNIGPDVLPIAKNFLRTTQEVCNKDTLLHAAVTSNLKCFDELIKVEDTKCTANHPREEKLIQHAEALVEEGLLTLTDNENETYTVYDCLRVMHYISCYALTVEDRCGTLAMDVFVELFQRLSPGAFEGDCDERFSLLPAVIRLHKLEREKEKEIEQSMRSVSYASDDCERRTADVCHMEKIPKEFPATEEDLDNFCTLVTEYFECGISRSERCNIDENVLPTVVNIYSTIPEICNKDTLLHAAVVSNLKCFDELIKESDQICINAYPTVEEVAQRAEALVEEGLLTLTDNENETNATYECIRTMHFLSCYALTVEDRCGTLAMDVFVELFQKLASVMFLQEECEEIFHLLPSVVRLHKLEIEKEKDVQQALRETK